VAVTLLGLLFAAWHARRFTRASLLSAAGAALLASLLVAPYLGAYRTIHARDTLTREPGLSAEMAFQPGRDLTSHGYLYGSLLGKGGERLFPGLLAPALATLALARRRAHASFYWAAVAFLVLVSLGPSGLVYRWLFAIPPLDSMRHPYSFAGVAALLLAVPAGIGLASLESARSRWIGPAAVAFAVLETLGPPARLQDVPVGVPSAYEVVAKLPPGPVLEIPAFNHWTMLWATRHRLTTLNGSGAFVPRDTLRFKNRAEKEWLVRRPAEIDTSESLQLLRGLGARYVIVPCGREPEFQPLARAFDRSQTMVLVMESAQRDRIYRVR
jgi:hypothetical protein